MTNTAKRGTELIQDPSLNKSTAFTGAERRSLGLIGPVHDVTETIRQHVYKPEYQTLVGVSNCRRGWTRRFSPVAKPCRN
jgi:hypothetical protein